MDYNFKLVEKPAQTVVSIRTRVAVEDISMVFSRGYHAILDYLSEAGEEPAGVPFAVYYNEDMQDMDVEIGFPVSRVLEGKNEIKAGEIPAGKRATCLYTGPYNQIEPAYNALSKWVQENGYKYSGIAYEVYINDPAHTPENELQTIIEFDLV